MKLFYLDFGCAFLMSLLDLLIPGLIAVLIDDAIPNKNLDNLMYISFFIFIVYVLRYILNYIVTYWGHVLGVRIESDMRSDLFHHIQKLSFNYFDNTKTGHIMSRLINDLFDIAEFAHHGPEDIFIASVTLIGTFIIMVLNSWKLTLITFSLVPVMIAFTILKNKKMKSAFRETKARIADINAQIEDSISGIRVVQSFGNENYEKDKFEVGNNDYKEIKEDSYKYMGEFHSGIGLFSNVLNLVVIFFGGLFVYYNQISIGVFVQFMLYISIFLEPVKRIANLMETFQKAGAGFGRFIEVMNIHPDIVDAPNAKNMSKAKGQITFSNVGFKYNDSEQVLSNINLKIEQGETIALVGPSGAGKTTICSLIPRFYEVTSGKIAIDDMDIRDVTLKSLRENIGIVQQDVFLFAGTISENIRYGDIEATEEDVIRAAKLANAHEFISKLPNSYDTFTGERGVKLSGGQKQRISIARIFLKNPSILILDEATSALDNENERIIQESFDLLSKSRTTLVIAHRLATVQNADRIIVLTDEGITEQGTHEELIALEGVYKSLYDAQKLQ